MNEPEQPKRPKPTRPHAAQQPAGGKASRRPRGKAASAKEASDRMDENEGIAVNGPNRPGTQGKSDFPTSGINTSIRSTGSRDAKTHPHEYEPGPPGTGNGMPAEDTTRERTD